MGPSVVLDDFQILFIVFVANSTTGAGGEEAMGSSSFRFRVILEEAEIFGTGVGIGGRGSVGNDGQCQERGEEKGDELHLIDLSYWWLLIVFEFELMQFEFCEPSPQQS